MIRHQLAWYAASKMPSFKFQQKKHLKIDQKLQSTPGEVLWLLVPLHGYSQTILPRHLRSTPFLSCGKYFYSLSTDIWSCRGKQQTFEGRLGHWGGWVGTRGEHATFGWGHFWPQNHRFFWVFSLSVSTAGEGSPWCRGGDTETTAS